MVDSGRVASYTADMAASQPVQVATRKPRAGNATRESIMATALRLFAQRGIDAVSLNEIVQVWPYRDLSERTRIRAEAAKDANWPPKIRDFVVHQHVELVTPFSFIPEITPGNVGPVFEMRCYSLTPGSLPGVASRWESKIAERTKLSPVVMAGGVEFGQANRFIHIWAYKSMNQRMEVREQARKAGVWPPPGGGEELLAQENKIMMPSSFSPLQ